MGKAQKIAEAATDAANLAKQAQQELGRLQRQAKRQRVLLQALWQLIRARLNLPDEELFRLASEIEKAEKETPRVADLCPQCGRPLQENFAKCIYCGADTPQSESF